MCIDVFIRTSLFTFELPKKNDSEKGSTVFTLYVHILYCSKKIRLHEFICIFLLCRFIHYSRIWYILKENSIPRSTRGESRVYNYCGRHSSSMNDIPPHFKSNTITAIA